MLFISKCESSLQSGIISSSSLRTEVFTNLGRMHMGLCRKVVFLMLISFVFTTTICFAKTEAEDKKAELERVFGQLRDNLGNKATLAALTFPEDTSPRFAVKEVYVSGNSLISTAELLEHLPLAYKVSVRRDDTTVEESYDFRVLLEIIVEPGRDRDVSLKTIQGLTKYVLSVYQDKGYAGV